MTTFETSVVVGLYFLCFVKALEFICRALEPRRRGGIRAPLASGDGPVSSNAEEFLFLIECPQPRTAPPNSCPAPI